ncbi:type II secretion system F family protein [Planctomycetota bacterium]
MPSYEYIAIDGNGKKVKGTLTAESPYAARKQLRLRSVHPSSIEEVTATAERKKKVVSWFSKPKKSLIIDFTKQMATMLNSGIKLTEALSVLTIQTSDQRFSNVLTEIRDRVITGESLAETLRDYRDYFDVVYVSMIQVGEMTGNLGASLATMGGFMEKRQRVESKVVTAMIYPVIMIIVCLAAVLFLTTKVIPPITEQIQNAGQELPGITQFLMHVSNTLTSWRIVLVIAALGMAGWLLQRFFATEHGAYLRDKALLSMPLFGKLIKQRVVSRFASTLSTLLSSGLPMAESLRVVAEVTGNVLMKKAVQGARERILAGADITSPLRDSGVISPAIAHMVAVGEKSGELEHMLRNISEDLEANTDIVIERLSAVIEPVIIIGIAAIVGVIAYATILPIMKLSSIDF